MDQLNGTAYSKEQEREEQEQSKRARVNRVRVAFKLLIVPFLLFFSLIIGLLIGYSVMGKMPASDVFNWNTYKHMYDLIFAGT